MRATSEFDKMSVVQQSTLPNIDGPAQDRCCMCGLAITELLTAAHLHDSPRTVRLCWTCHRAYDIDILNTEEVLAAETETRAGSRRVDVSAMHNEWARDLASGKRRVNKQRQHGRTPEQSSANARKAWETMRAAVLREVGNPDSQLKRGPEPKQHTLFRGS
jgi:hypothetical protein